MSLDTILLIGALICFLIDVARSLGLRLGTFNFLALGLALWVLTGLV